jgi:F0F1-type ATP synthase assembly protein I
MLVLPVLAGVLIGYAVSQRIGHPWPAVLGLVLGLVVGAYVVWRSVDRSLRQTDEDDDASDIPEGGTPP